MEELGGVVGAAMTGVDADDEVPGIPARRRVVGTVDKAEIDADAGAAKPKLVVGIVGLRSERNVQDVPAFAGRVFYFDIGSKIGAFPNGLGEALGEVAGKAGEPGGVTAAFYFDIAEGA